MFRTLILFCFLLFFSSPKSQSLVDSDFEGKDQIFFENYFKINRPKEIEGVWVFSDDNFVTYHSKTAIVRTENKYLEILLEGIENRNGEVVDIFETKNDKVYKDYKDFVDYGPYYVHSSKSNGSFKQIAYFKNDRINYIENDSWYLKRKFKKKWSTIGSETKRDEDKRFLIHTDLLKK